MKKLLLTFLCAFLLACNQNSTPVFDKLTQDSVILAFGDSLTYGTGSTNNASYPSILSSISGHKVINAGIPGEISELGLARLATLLDQHQPELLILIHGGNDMLRKIPLQQTASNLALMISAAQQRNVKVVMLGVPAPRLFLLSSAEIYQQVAEQHNIPVDLETLPKILGDNSLKSDAIHPNNQGYQLIADNILGLLVASGAL